ncbi:hypothetical protein ACYATM_03940 [Lactobacillaceae bacterium Scapto_B20]
MWAYVVAIVAILCGSAIAIDKHHANDRPENDDLQKQIDRLESEIRSIKHKLNEK